MNCRGIKVAVLAIALCATARAQTTASEGWVGIWHANVGGQPTGTLTLATDTGELGGTIVLDMVNDRSGTPKVIESEPHVLMNPVADSNTLTFQVKMQRPQGSSFLASFEVKRTATDKATIHCVNCGADAPVVDLVRDL
ncbi:MAG: hypothetical protein ABSD61_07110 [Terracidiphilus sp.]|jgi:hypothetical protein